MRISILYSEFNPPDYIRLLQPAKYFEGIDIKLINHKECKEKEAETFTCDILFFSRLFIYDWKTMIELKKKYGFKIVVDFDDYYKLYPHQLRYKLWLEHDVSNRMIQACKGADLVFVTNEQLYNVYKEFNRNILIVPNALPFDKEPMKVESDKVRFMYVAGQTHYRDLRILKGLFDRLRSDGDFKRKATFTFCGYDPAPSKQNLSAKMESICRINGAYVRRNIMPLDSYMDHYNYGDVSIAPLDNNLFNTLKSNLKYIEAASMRHAFICTESLPYTLDMELKDKGILFCNKTADWYKAFKFFLNNPNAVKDFGEINYGYAKEKYNLKDANELRMQAFKITLQKHLFLESVPDRTFLKIH